MVCENSVHSSIFLFVQMVSAMAGMARCAVPARVVAGGTNSRATLAIEGVAPLHAARTSRRDVPTTLNRHSSIAFDSSEDRPARAHFVFCNNSAHCWRAGTSLHDV